MHASSRQNKSSCAPRRLQAGVCRQRINVKMQSPGAYRAYVLAVLLLVNVLNQWDRYLMYYLSAITVQQCVDVCDGVPQRFCEPCQLSDTTCDACHVCLRTHNVEDINLQGALLVATAVLLLLPPVACGCLFLLAVAPRICSSHSVTCSADATCLTGVQYGLLTGIVFTLVYSLFGLLLAPLPDRVNKKNLLAAGVFLWSLASAVRP
jgi:hypothetical protein